MMFDSYLVIDWILVGILLLNTIVQLYYYWGVFAKLAFYKQTQGLANPEPVSIIIAARNEYENLQRYLPAILEQDYPEFEVIVVNDCSWDESQAWLEEYQKTQPRLRVSQLIEQEKYPTGKKFALTIGIKAAKHDLLLFTDADCQPQSNQWLKSMQSHFVKGIDIVVGFSPYEKRKGLLNLFIRYETLLTAQFYLSATLLKRPFMGVGRNLAYRKELFFKFKGFASHQHIISGDDDLFVNQASSPTNVAIEINPSTFVITEPKTTFSTWAHQKIRHMNVGKLYKLTDKRFLGTYYLTAVVFYMALAAAIILNPFTWPVVGIIFGIKFISQSIICYLCGKKLKYQSVAFYVLLLDLLYVLYLLTFGVRAFFLKRLTKW